MADEKQRNIDELLSRGIGSYIDPEGAFKKKLAENPEKIVIKFGVDPTRPDIHLGHAVILRTLRKFQDIGCKVIFLIGDFTASIGDPTGKSKIRPEIEQKAIEENLQTYLDQVVKILRIDEPVFSWMRNSDWLYNVTDIEPSADSQISIDIMDAGIEKKFPIPPQSFVGKALLFENTRMQKTLVKKNEVTSITLRGILWTLKHISYSRLIERDMFQDRIKKGEPVFMHEMLYPVIQGIDSFVLSLVYGSCDLEVGGTDQHFNMLMGREIMEMNKVFPQAVLSFKILEGLDGKEKMSKSLDNYIAITDESVDMYGKVMSIPDASITNYFELATYTPLPEIEEMREKLEKGTIHPKDLKMKLAREIVAIYHGEQKATDAETAFINTFQKKEVPENIAEYKIKKNTLLVDFLIGEKLVESKSEFGRLIEQKAIKTVMGNGDKEEVITDAKKIVEESAVIRIGKHRFIKININ